MGCADYCLCGVCHPYRPGGYVLYGNVGKGKKRGASESDALFLIAKLSGDFKFNNYLMEILLVKNLFFTVILVSLQS